MSISRVSQLGYLGLEVRDVPAWELFATSVLGLQSSGLDPDGRLFLRMDEKHHRFALQQGERDDLSYVGWETQDAESLHAIAGRLESQGIQITWGSAAQARARHVVGLISFPDPSGIATEVYYGPLVEFERPFHSQRAIGGFTTGDLGMGHIVVNVDDYEKSLAFYRDGLGLRLSDYIEIEMGAAGSTMIAFLHCGPRHHSIAMGQFGAPKRLHHFMLELQNMDDVGSTYDLCQRQGVPIMSSLGCHTNDRMLSFYMQAPSGFQVEYGFGGRVIDDTVWSVQLHRAPSIWGHHPPRVTAHAAAG